MTEDNLIHNPSPDVVVTDPNGATKLCNYCPLIALAFVSVVMAHVMHRAYELPFMSLLMGFVLVNFALVKLVDIDAFVDRFSKYDIISKRTRLYGYVFPLIELGIGLAFLGAYNPMLTSWVLLIVGIISVVGVLTQFKNRETMNCACMGGVGNVPLGVVTVAENALMIGMALSYIMGVH